MTACALLLYHVIVARATAHDKPTGRTSGRAGKGDYTMTTKTTNTTNTNTRQYYALDWNPSNAYCYTDDAIRKWGAQIATVLTFGSKAKRDKYINGEAYSEAISARRAYRIDPSVRPGFGRKRATCWF